ncbi:MAG TPA: K(+)-transporting ATPase subunit F [Acidimicrobiia bacterium]|nr:K(+)-transporting ATPase subunit F [Acidimicrobiia bacterium]
MSPGVGGVNTVDNLIGLVLAVLLTGYLIYALVFPEKL